MSEKNEGLIFKLKSLGISDAWLDLIESFLKCRFQGVVLNGQILELLTVKQLYLKDPFRSTLFSSFH